LCIVLNNSLVASCVVDFSVVYQYPAVGALVTVEVPHVGRLEAHTRAALVADEFNGLNVGGFEQ
jgi:hypothetical protein